VMRSGDHFGGAGSRVDVDERPERIDEDRVVGGRSESLICVEFHGNAATVGDVCRRRRQPEIGKAEAVHEANGTNSAHEPSTTAPPAPNSRSAESYGRPRTRASDAPTADVRRHRVPHPSRDLVPSDKRHPNGVLDSAALGPWSIRIPKRGAGSTRRQ
jgi:hypothetical protein